MAREDFRAKVKEEIKELNREQTIDFALLCAIRAIPFLGAKKPVRYWKKMIGKNIFLLYLMLLMW